MYPAVVLYAATVASHTLATYQSLSAAQSRKAGRRTLVRYIFIQQLIQHPDSDDVSGYFQILYSTF